MSLGMEALMWGFISAVSLPIGSLLGIWLKPGRRISSAFMAFGAGALLFALTIELFSVSLHHAESHGNGVVYATIVGALLGGLIFDFLNQLLNNRGAFLRSFSNTRKYLRQLKIRNARKTVEQLCKIKVFQGFPADEMAQLLTSMKREKFNKDEVIFKENDTATTLYFILDGHVDISKEGKHIATLGENDTFGEMAVVTNNPRMATAKAMDATTVYKMEQSDFDHILEEHPEVRYSVERLVSQRVGELASNMEIQSVSESDAEHWREQTMDHLIDLTMPVSEKEMEQAGGHAGKGAALAIWLGIMIDAVPESLVIGMVANSTNGISLALIAGVFLANFPEAMSSSVGMQNSGMKLKKIMMLWMSIVVVTTIGAWIGAVAFPTNPTGTMFYVISGIEGLAAGAMLTAIAESMLPEAYEQGGAIVGFSTLMGFVVALLVKLI